MLELIHIDNNKKTTEITVSTAFSNTTHFRHTHSFELTLTEHKFIYDFADELYKLQEKGIKKYSFNNKRLTKINKIYHKVFWPVLSKVNTKFY